jgi:DNA repair exonuclease SbcCD ATPase subunit
MKLNVCDATPAKEPTSEERLGIREQPDPTCPMLDSVIRELQRATKELDRWQRDKEDAEALATRCEYAEWRLGGIEEELEKIRSHVSEIRAWGQEWKDLAKELERTNQQAVREAQ